MSQNLANFRKQIDVVNKRIFHLIVARIKVAQKIAGYKQRHHLKMVDKKREKEIIADIKRLAREKKINTKLSGEIFRKIIQLTKIEIGKF